MDEKTIARFWSKVDKNGPVPVHRPELGACWVWIARTYLGYGIFKLEGKFQKAHRVSWRIETGGAPVDCVLHHCDNRACVRHSHHFAGSNTDNNIDMRAKGRQVNPLGSKNGNAVLMERDALEIRAMYDRGESGVVIADRFGIGKQTAYDVIHRKYWRHV